MDLGGKEGLNALQAPLTGNPTNTPSETQDFVSITVNPQTAPPALLFPSKSSKSKSSRHATDAVGIDSHERASGFSGSSSASTSVPARGGHDSLSLSSSADVASLAVRRMKGRPDGPGSTRRMVTPSRTSADARSALQRSLRADSVVANCVAGRIDLEKLSEMLAPSIVPEEEGELKMRSPERPNVGLSAIWSATPGNVRPVTGVAAASSSSSSSSAHVQSLRLKDAQMMQKYGTGENLVIQLRVFGDKDLFVFLFGCIVFWGLTQQQLQASKELLRDFMERELTVQDLEEERMEFVNELGRDDMEDGQEVDTEEPDREMSAIKHDQIILSTNNSFERLAHSYALAQSVRLSVFENAVDRSIANTRSIPETMAETGEVNLEAKDLARQMGGLLMLRCDVNLHTDILDTPEIFWDEERFEPHYIACRTYLDVDKRVDILNQRLGVLKDLYDLLQNGINVKHGNKLEVIIIVLILIEVLLELMELLHDSWSG